MSLPNGVNASCDGKSFHPGFEVQLCGALMKKIPKTSNKWKKKFCAIRDGYLFVFREDAIVQNNGRGVGIPMWPLEGVFPLAKADVKETGDNEFPFCFTLSSTEFSETSLFSANHADILSRWIQALKNAKQISHENLSSLMSLHNVRDDNARLTKENLMLIEVNRELRHQKDELFRLNETLDNEKLGIQQKLRDMEVQMVDLKKKSASPAPTVAPVPSPKPTMVSKLTVEENTQLKRQVKELQDEITKLRKAHESVQNEANTLGTQLKLDKQSRQTMERRITEMEKQLAEAQKAGGKNTNSKDVSQLRKYFETQTMKGETVSTRQSVPNKNRSASTDFDLIIRD